MSGVGVLGLLSLLSGCASIQRNGEPDGFQRSLTELRAKHQPNDRKIGTLPWDYALSFSGDGKTALAAVGIPAPDLDDIEQRKLLAFSGLKADQQMCFFLFEKLEWNDYGNLRAEEEPKFIASRRARMESGEFYLEAFDSLLDVPTRPVLPTSGRARLTVRSAAMGLEVTYKRRRFYDAKGNAKTRTSRREEPEMMYELCGPAPAATPTTRYFTVAHKFREASLVENYTHFLYVFARQDGGEPSLDLRGGEGAPPVTATRPVPSTQPTSGEPSQTPAATDPPKRAGKPRSSQMMSIGQSILASGTTLTVTFPKPMKATPGEKFWVTIVDALAGETAYTSYTYLEADATSIDLAAPPVTGDYEVRLHGNYPTKTYNLIDRLKFRATQGDPSSETEPEASAPVPSPEEDKGASSKMMSTAKVRLDAKAQFTVKFRKPLKAKRSEKYWIAISKVSAAAADYDSYRYLDPAPPSIDLTAPDAPGEYELRLHGNYPTKKTNVIDRLKITVK